VSTGVQALERLGECVVVGSDEGVVLGVEQDVGEDIDTARPACGAEALEKVGSASWKHSQARFELECSGCSYGAIVSTMPTQCPMCACKDWDFAGWRQFRR
jgi:hypothetical protein